MRLVILMLGSLLATAWLAGPAAAQGQSWPNKAFGGKPDAAVQISMGDAPRGAQLVKIVEMRNIWDTPLDITNIKVSCGCTKATTPVLKILPGQVAPITIEVDGTRYEKPIQVTISVATAKTTSQANLIVSANFHQNVVMAPNELRFDAVKRGMPNERTLVVEYSGKAPWAITGVVKSDKAPFELKAEALPVKQVNGAAVVSYKITATLKPNASLGAFRETVDLKTGNAKEDLSFVVAGSVVPAVEVFPNPVVVANLQVGATSSTKVVVAAGEPFVVTGFVSNDKDVKVAIPGGPAAVTHILDIQVTPGAAGRLTREVILQTNLRNETVRVVLQGNAN